MRQALHTDFLKQNCNWSDKRWNLNLSQLEDALWKCIESQNPTKLFPSLQPVLGDSIIKLALHVIKLLTKINWNLTFFFLNFILCYAADVVVIESLSMWVKQDLSERPCTGETGVAAIKQTSLGSSKYDLRNKT